MLEFLFVCIAGTLEYFSEHQVFGRFEESGDLLLLSLDFQAEGVTLCWLKTRLIGGFRVCLLFS